MRYYLTWKTFVLFVAFVIAGIALYYFSNLVEEIEAEESKRMELLVEGIQTINNVEINNGTSDITYAAKVVSSNTSIPLIIIGDNGQIVDYRNLDSLRVATNPQYLEKKLEEFKKQHQPIFIQNYGVINHIYYGDSHLLNRLRYYPFILIGVLAFLVIVLIAIVTNSQKSIQNQLWVGMSKETAHQLGTPLTSIVAWMELLRENEANREWVDEMEKDIERLQLIADRFSKIGSVPQLYEENVTQRLHNMVAYMQKRAPVKVNISIDTEKVPNVFANLSAPLFDWVLENLIRNALDAMEGQGNIHIELCNTPREVTIDISDTGKGIPKKNFKKVFTPGYSTKTRGWGLGLSLAKRIINDFHNGSLYVKKSEIGKGTTFRIILRR